MPSLALALLSALAWDGLRINAFEAEKLDLLSLACVFLLPSILRAAKRLQRQPLVWLSLGLLIWMGISSLLALSPTRALFGSDERSLGWTAWLVGIILLMSASSLGEHLRRLWPVIWTILSVPIVVLTLLQVASGTLVNSRPVATMGNPNFLAAWLGFALLSLAFSPPEGLQRRRWIVWLMGLGALFLALNLSGSRAGLLSVGAGLGLVACVLPLVFRPRLTKHQAGLSLVVIGSIVGLLTVFGGGQRLVNSLSSSDEVRLAYYEEGVALVKRMSEPLLNAAQQPDSLAHLRPWIGYGLDNLDALDDRLYPIQERINVDLYADRLHNLTFDSLLMTGWIGLVLHMILFQTALWLCLRPIINLPLRRLGLLLSWEVGTVILWMGLGGLIDLGLGLRWALAPLAALAGAGAWLLVQALRGERGLVDWRTARWPLMLLALVVHNLVNNLFGFPTLASWAAWWVTLGLVARLTMAAEDDAQGASDDWLPFGLGSSALFLALMSGQQALSNALLLSWVGGSALVLCSLVWHMGARLPWRRLAIYGALIAAYALLTELLRTDPLLRMNEALLRAPETTLTDLTLAALSLSGWRLLGYGLVMVCLLGWPISWRSWTRGQKLVVISLLTATGLTYSFNHSSSALQHVDQALRLFPSAVHVRLLALEAAVQLTPWNTDRLASLVNLQYSLGVDNHRTWEALRALDPYAQRRPNGPSG
ncbi:MAG: O-antigen ligase family protein [Anaerolineae bacterium]|nr:O-antigen ligase family protein [Anaerolineae bacterium]MDW8173731.1 O-antigen ligase family protein [Anaerolineae bacterium]